jgi:hypothetical protein
VPSLAIISDDPLVLVVSTLLRFLIRLGH